MFYQRRNLQVLLCTLAFPKNIQANKMRRKNILVTKLALFIACIIPVLMSTINTFVENGKNIENTFKALKYRPENNPCGVTLQSPWIGRLRFYCVYGISIAIRYPHVCCVRYL
ncbi:hypothetical protein TNIN_321311 [Trichonephila inaurata madagascariensis]|uniref:Uncharacterized protein n=1 Tax=Trichonephila inaurata madagascariensis TaxID=2747483 RepID=A0A8X6X852_9ARAC|nr:hypothetical protein TNIN_321311 [Trichonephila inaurata madagascariensis]